MSTAPNKPRQGQAGLTLIEVLISMIILSIITTMLVVGWVSLQRGSAFAITSNNARGTARDAISRISSDLRAAQPNALPIPAPSASVTPAALPPITYARPMDVRFYSAYNSTTAAADGTGVAAVRMTRIWLETSTKKLWLYRDTTGNGDASDAGDRKILLARNVVNNDPAIGSDPTNDPPSGGTSYHPLFRYAYRTSLSSPVQWTDNAGGTLDLGTIVAIRARVIIDANIAHTPKFIDATTTVRLRNASGS
jgi:prepilin-type N-terminal cleavage/methylation domain-containing protein